MTALRCWPHLTQLEVLESGLVNSLELRGEAGDLDVVSSAKRSSVRSRARPPREREEER